jgi:hypothetical protein
VLYRLSYVGSIPLLAQRGTRVWSGQWRIRTTEAYAPDLQSGPIVHSGNCPCTGTSRGARRADDGTRTRNLLFTKQLLCQLSYVGKPDATKSCANGEYTNGFDERQREIEGFLRCLKRCQLAGLPARFKYTTE